MHLVTWEYARHTFPAWEYARHTSFIINLGCIVSDRKVKIAMVVIFRFRFNKEVWPATGR